MSKNVVANIAPVARFAPLFATSPQNVAEARDSMTYAIGERMNWEVQHNPVPSDLASITQYLSAFKKRIAKCDAYTLGFFAENARDFGTVFLSHRRVNAMMNVYAFPKCLSTGRALNGSALSGSDANDETIAGIVLAMARGEQNGKQLAFALNDYMNREGAGRGNYSSGATQCSSALRALEALEVVECLGQDGASKMWGIRNVSRFNRLVDAARGNMQNVIPAEEAPLGWDVIDTSVMNEENAPAPATVDATAPVCELPTDAEIDAHSENVEEAQEAAPAIDAAAVKRDAKNAARRAKRAAAKG